MDHSTGITYWNYWPGELRSVMGPSWGSHLLQLFQTSQLLRETGLDAREPTTMSTTSFFSWSPWWTHPSSRHFQNITSFVKSSVGQDCPLCTISGHKYGGGLGSTGSEASSPNFLVVWPWEACLNSVCVSILTSKKVLMSQSCYEEYIR